MKRTTLINLKKAASYLKKEYKRKYISLDMLSEGIGVYPDVLANEISFINPVLLMDPSINMKDLLVPMEEAIKKEEEIRKKEPRRHYEAVRKKELAEYPDVASFVYTKMTNAGGLVDTSISLSDHDLRLLKKIIIRELSLRRKAKIEVRNKKIS